jgi:hypothetical protein
LPDTLAQVSPTGSVHLFVACELPNGTNTLGSGIDTKQGGHGYIVGAGSWVRAHGKTRATGFYQCTSDAPIAPLEWIDEIPKPRPQAPDRGDIVKDPDALVDFDLACEALKYLDVSNFSTNGGWEPLLMSFHYLTGGQGFEFFDAWSEGDDNFATDEARRQRKIRWDSLHVHYRGKGDKDERHFIDEVCKVRPDLGGKLLCQAAGFDEPVDDGPPISREEVAKLYEMVGLEPPSDAVATAFPPPLSGPEMAMADFPDPQWPVEGFIMEGIPQTLDGDGGMGKSLVAAQMCVAIATGKPIFGRTVKQGPVLYVSHEDPTSEVKKRMEAMAKTLGTSLAELPQLRTWCLSGHDITLADINERGVAKLQPFHQALDEQLAQQPGSFVVLDCFADVAAIEGVGRAPPNTFYKTILAGLCAKHRATILVLCHPSKASMADGSWYDGSTANRTAVRNKLVMKLVDKDVLDGPRELGTLKRNYGSLGKPVRLTFDHGIGIFVADTGEARGERSELHKAVVAKIKELILAGKTVAMSNQAAGFGPKDVADALKKDNKVEVDWHKVKTIMKAADRDGELTYHAAERGGHAKAHFSIPDPAIAKVAQPQAEVPNEFFGEGAE